MATLAIDKPQTAALVDDLTRLRELLYEDFALARDYLPEVRQRHGDVPELANWIRVLGPAKVTRGRLEQPAKDRIHDFNWIKANAEAYYGQWLALSDGELLAHGLDLDTVRSLARAKSPGSDFLLFHAVGMPE